MQGASAALEQSTLGMPLCDLTGLCPCFYRLMKIVPVCEELLNYTDQCRIPGHFTSLKGYGLSEIMH